jgi:hypothetical protein
MVNKGFVKRIKKERVSKSNDLNNIANTNPMFLVSLCFSAGSLSVTMEIKIILSMPRTISRNVSVRRAIQFSG